MELRQVHTDLIVARMDLLDRRVADAVRWAMIDAEIDLDQLIIRTGLHLDDLAVKLGAAASFTVHDLIVIAYALNRNPSDFLGGEGSAAGKAAQPTSTATNDDRGVA